MLEKRSEKIKYALLAATILLIWGQSLIPGKLSSEESSSILNLLRPLWDSIGLNRAAFLDEHLVRKLFGHFAEYLVLGLQVGNLNTRNTYAGNPLAGNPNMEDPLAENRDVKVPFPGVKSSFFLQILKKMNFCLIIAFIDESLQLLSPNRGPEVSDIWLDLSGAALGVLTLTILHFRRDLVP